MTTNLNVKRLYNHNQCPNGIWNCEDDRACTGAEIAAAIRGEIEMRERHYIAGHPSWGTRKLDGPNWPSKTHDAGFRVLSPSELAEFADRADRQP